MLKTQTLPLRTPTLSHQKKTTMSQSVVFALIAVNVSFLNLSVQASPLNAEKPAFISKTELGERLFYDPTLSLNRQQACSTCHNPNHGFIDTRALNNQRFSTSLGADNQSKGTRNTPTITYAQFSPIFSWQAHSRFNSQQPDYVGFVGGQFLDGREDDLQGQAGGPPLNPIEMQMPNKTAIVDRLKEDTYYLKAFQAIYGQTVFDTPEQGYLAITEVLAEFEKLPKISPFDSKYDRVLKGKDSYSFKELSGKSLFFSQQFTNCATCHQSKPNGYTKETFSNYEYHNIGVPANLQLNQALGTNLADLGLFDNPKIAQYKTGANQGFKGQFKVPTLRNVAVTGPYMHNGVFKDLRTVVEFYDHFLVGSKHKINPETQQAWLPAEVPETIAEKELKDGRKLKSMQVEQMVCFLRTLTDKRYEHLIEENGIKCED